jgi:hypothetical protein
VESSVNNAPIYRQTWARTDAAPNGPVKSGTPKMVTVARFYADRQWQTEIEILYGNMVKIFIPDGDATIVVRKKEVVRLD